MKKIRLLKRSTAIEVISALLILLFLYTALSKAVEFSTFRISLLESPLIGRGHLPREWAYFIGWSLISVEFLASMLLFFPKTRLIGLYTSFVLMIIFTFYIGYIVVFMGRDVPCSCGGVIAYLNWPQHLLFNIFFTALAGAGIWLQRKERKIPDVKPGGLFA